MIYTGQTIQLKPSTDIFYVISGCINLLRCTVYTCSGVACAVNYCKFYGLYSYIIYMAEKKLSDLNFMESRQLVSLQQNSKVNGF